jgi:hypothetical protein
MIEIVNPSGIPRVGRSRLALRRFDNLAGKRIGLLDNNKPNADRFLEFVGAQLKERYADIELVTQRKMTRMEADVLPDLIQRCDVVINAFAD